MGLRTDPRRMALHLLLLVLLIAGSWIALRVVRVSDRATARQAALPGPGVAAELAAAAADEPAPRLEAGLAGTEDAGGLALRAGVRLPGAGRLEGRVLSRADGAGVAGARIALHTIPPAGLDIVGRVMRAAGVDAELAARIQPAAIEISDSDGRFAFEGVRPGSYFAEARGPWHVPDAAVQARVAASGAGGPLELWVRPGGRVVGSVLRADGRAASGAAVALRQGITTLVSAARRHDLVFLATRADDQGRFQLAGVPPGEGYELSAMGAGLTLSHAGDIAVRAGEDTQVSLRGRAGGVVRGRVLAADPEGADETRPLSGAHVGAVPRGLRDLHFAVEVLHATHATTGADGSYQLAAVPPGEIDVVAIAEGHLAAKGPALVALEGGASESEPIVLRTGPMVSGRVVDSAKRPIPGVSVRWDLVDWSELEFDLTLAPMLSQAIEGFDFPLTDGEGRFRAGAFPGDPPHRIQVRKAGYGNASRNWNPTEQGQEIEIVLAAGGAVEGVVLDARTLEPIPSFTITGNDRIDGEPGAPGADNPFTGGQLVEDPDGRFRVEGVRAGKSQLSFEAPGYVGRDAPDLAVAEGETLRGVVVKLQPGCVVRGRVRDAEGRPVVGAQVLPVEGGGRRGGGGPLGEVMSSNQVPRGLVSLAVGVGALSGFASLSGPDGTFEILGLPAGVCVLGAEHPDFVFGRSAALEIPEGGSVEGVEIELSGGGGLYGRVVDRFDRPVPGAMVVALSPAGLTGAETAGGDLYQARADAEGEYAIEHMNAGGYFAVVLRPDDAVTLPSILGSLQMDLVTIPADQRIERDLLDRSASACRVFGEVRSAGTPVDGGILIALSFAGDGGLGADFKMAPVKADGSYSFPGLAPGDYQLQYEGDQDETSLSVEVPDQAEYRLDIELPRGSIEGRVLDQRTREPVPRAEVWLAPMDAKKPSGFLGSLLPLEGRTARSRADEAGAFQIERVEAGRYLLSAGAPRWGAGEGDWAPSEPRTVVVEPHQLLEGIEILLEPSLSISGTVRDDGGRPVEAEIRAFRREGLEPHLASADSDEQGRFVLRGLDDAAYDLSTTAKDFATLRRDDVRPGGPELELVLMRGTEVRVRVRDARGLPAIGAVGMLQPAGPTRAGPIDGERTIGGWLQGRGVAGSDGELDLGRHMPGTYTLKVVRGSSQRLLEDLRVEEGAPLVLDVALP